MGQQTPHHLFKDHQIKRQDGRSLLLQSPKTSDMWCTIAIDDHGQIVVFGDFGPIVFGCCVVPFIHRIEWLGSHEQADSYVMEKAGIGMSDLGSALTVSSAEAFEADVRAEFAEKLQDLGDHHVPGPLRTALTWEAFRTHIDPDEMEILKWAALPAQRVLDDYVRDLGYIDNSEWIGSVGERPIPAIGLAHAALRRAHLLLKADEEPFA